MPSKAAFPLVVVFIQQVVKMKHTLVREGHTVTHEVVPFRPEILHECRPGIFCRARGDAQAIGENQRQNKKVYLFH